MAFIIYALSKKRIFIIPTTFYFCIMENEQNINYKRIEQAIEYIQVNFKSHPNLDEVAEKLHLSPFHFQQLFTDWVGVSPKKFLQYITVEHAKAILKKDTQTTLFETTIEVGLSSTSRLHDLFVNVEGMTSAEYKNGGENLVIDYNFAQSPFGNLIVASTSKGICYIAFEQNHKKALYDLKIKFPKAEFQHKSTLLQQNALLVFNNDWTDLPQIKLHLKGTDFQLKVWESLLKIPFGRLSTYGELAHEIGNPNASRAVGTAIGNNPIAYLIPCHRVIQSTGTFGGYMWNPIRKTAIIGWEQAKSYLKAFPENI